jgi:hypothetical protein
MYAAQATAQTGKTAQHSSHQLLTITNNSADNMLRDMQLIVPLVGAARGQ